MVTYILRLKCLKGTKSVMDANTAPGENEIVGGQQKEAQ